MLGTVTPPKKATPMAVRQDKKRGTWYYQIDLPRGADGKRHQAKERGFATEALALAAERRAVKASEALRPAADGSVESELRMWLDALAIDLSPTTVQGHRTKLDNYVFPYIGAIQLYRVTPDILNRLYIRLLREGKRDGSGLAPSSVLSVHKALVSGLRACGLTLDERKIRKPRAKIGHKGVWTEAQGRAFLNATAGHRLHAAFVLALVCGMRRGELAGLRWQSVCDGAINVRGPKANRAAADREPGGVVERSPKGTSERTIPIGPIITAVLEVRRAKWEAERAEAGTQWYGDSYVFCSVRGRPHYPGHFTRTFSALVKGTGLPDITLHDARHTMATVALAGGVDIKTLQARLGHAQGSTTIDLYGHPVTSTQREAAANLETRFLG
jgi:integrase